MSLAICSTPTERRLTVRSASNGSRGTSSTFSIRLFFRPSVCDLALDSRDRRSASYFSRAVRLAWHLLRMANSRTPQTVREDRRPRSRRAARRSLYAAADDLLYRWNVVRISEDCTYGIGEWNNGKLRWVDVLKCDEHQAIDASKQHQDVKAF